MNRCENIGCYDGYLECEFCNGTNLDEEGEICVDCFDGLVECECNINNIKNKNMMIVEINKYYKIRPIDYSPLVGKCIRYTVDGKTPIFEFHINGEPREGAFDMYRVEELTTDEFRELRLGKILDNI